MGISGGAELQDGLSGKTVWNGNKKEVATWRFV